MATAAWKEDLTTFERVNASSSPEDALVYGANVRMELGVQGAAAQAALGDPPQEQEDPQVDNNADNDEYTTLQRVVFENGHCLLPQQERASDYLLLLDKEVQAVAERVLAVHDTGMRVRLTGPKPMTLCMENVCGVMKINFDNVPSAGAILRPGAARVSTYVKNRQFIGTHHLLHTVHGRLAYRVEQRIWSFKGCRSLPDLVDFMRGLLEDYESAVYPTVNMLSVTLRTDTSLVIDPLHSLLQRVLERVYHGVVVMQQRVDDTNNLFFMDVVSWPKLLSVVERARQATAGGSAADDDVQHVRGYLRQNGRSSNSSSTQPTVSIGFTRHGCWFIRITFSRGCVCALEGSVGAGEGGAEPPGAVCAGGVQPFVQVVVRFILLLLVKIHAVGGVY